MLPVPINPNFIFPTFLFSKISSVLYTFFKFVYNLFSVSTIPCIALKVNIYLEFFLKIRYNLYTFSKNVYYYGVYSP